MKSRYRKFLRGKVWWCFDRQTGKQSSLETKNETEADSLLAVRNQPYQVAGFHLHMARTHLKCGNADSIKRTWKQVFETIINCKTGPTKFRWERAAKDKAFERIQNLPVIDTTADDLFAVLKSGTVSTNVYLRRLHNFALGLNWLLEALIPKNAWPKVQYSDKRAITLDEHNRIIEREKNPERKAYYQMCWLVGGSQTDMSWLQAENIDWQTRTLSYARKKNKKPAQMHIGRELETLLRSLPTSGFLFPNLVKVRESDRATEFRQRCAGLNIKGVTLHSYRYSWAERGATAGYPERYAQDALGHGSKAIIPRVFVSRLGTCSLAVRSLTTASTKRRHLTRR